MNKFELQDYIEDIELNGLRGRMINAPARNPKKRDTNILLVHGQHSSLERLAGAADLMMDYGNFCLPDMPGFGGMDHLYKIGEKPTLDALADYMAAFIKLRYGKSKKFIIIGYSFGFIVTVRMLQKYPEIQKQCKEVIALAGFLHKNDFKFTATRRRAYLIFSRILETKLVSWIVREFFLRKIFLGMFYTRSHNAKEKFQDLSPAEHKRLLAFETKLWRINHIPTWCYTSRLMLNADLATRGEKLPMPLISINIEADKYFNNDSVVEHFKMIFPKVKVINAESAHHGGGIIESAKEAAPFFPKSLRKYIK
ncbi:alpha/beta hydrolase [Candidatus Saccharibacteria bacterium]|nr:alpha/beta hydrolase [Candidatus Saccharibacteria bacterium]